MITGLSLSFPFAVLWLSFSFPLAILYLFLDLILLTNRELAGYSDAQQMLLLTNDT
jgi:hypothetical protein